MKTPVKMYCNSCKRFNLSLFPSVKLEMSIWEVGKISECKFWIRPDFLVPNPITKEDTTSISSLSRNSTFGPVHVHSLYTCILFNKNVIVVKEQDTRDAIIKDEIYDGCGGGQTEKHILGPSEHFPSVCFFIPSFHL